MSRVESVTRVHGQGTEEVLFAEGKMSGRQVGSRWSVSCLCRTRGHPRTRTRPRSSRFPSRD